MTSISLQQFLDLEKYTKKYVVKVYISQRNNDGTYKIKDDTACVSLEIEDGAEEANKMIGPGIYMRLVNPKKISDEKISMPRKSSSSTTRPFPLGQNVSPVKDEKPQSKSPEASKNQVDSLMEVLLTAKPSQVSTYFNDFNS